MPVDWNWLMHRVSALLWQFRKQIGWLDGIGKQRHSKKRNDYKVYSVNTKKKIPVVLMNLLSHAESSQIDFNI